MRSLRRERKGQFVIIVALLIASLTLSLAFSIHEINLQKQELRYQPVNELLLGVTSDMERALSKALSNYTKTLLDGYSPATATQFGTQFMSTWKKAVLTSYAALDLTLVQDNLIFSSSWNGPVGYSGARTEYKIDVNGYEVKGWVGITAKYVRLEFFPDSINFTNPDQTTLDFTLTESAVNQNEMIPISNLSPELVFIDSLPLGFSKLSKVDSLTYTGNGTYTATTKEKINPNTRGLLLRVATPDDKIWVQTNFYQPIYLTFATREEPPGNSSNPMGQIRFRDKTYPSDGAFGTQIQVDPTFDSVPYYLEFIPDSNYAFVRWEIDTPFVNVNDPLPVTALTVEGSGNITAVYAAGNNTIVLPEYCNILLDSREWNYTYLHDPQIWLDLTPYDYLPQNVSKPEGLYELTYVPKNASYAFYGWQFEGAVALVGSYAQNTSVRVYGDANITALYTFTQDNIIPPPPPPPPPPLPWGNWNSLYFDEKRTLVPGYMWSGKDGHDQTHSSQGNMKQTTTLTTPIPTPNITCAQLINFTVFITPVPQDSVKGMDLVFGFIFGGQYYLIGNFTFSPINQTTTIYRATIDVDNTIWVQGYGPRVIPEGSTLQLDQTITFLNKNGFNFVYHGIGNPSRIDLF